MPFTRSGGRFSSAAMNCVSGTSSRRAFSPRMAAPRRQVSITTISAAPTATGIQPPSTSFNALAKRNTASMARKGAIRRADAAGDQPHTRQSTKKAITAVTTMVPVTAIP